MEFEEFCDMLIRHLKMISDLQEELKLYQKENEALKEQFEALKNKK